ncbi:MAG: hypothetical protein A2Y17_10435 [Clostridiales bacterium GWF2_38_85]|nr:MAG: hypothetical protein A2Y17_10435 [Clostridiales bacterium GWF2_38_85]HBL84845.1 hypothetical protein [Clostridiales bacterium]
MNEDKNNFDEPIEPIELPKKKNVEENQVEETDIPVVAFDDNSNSANTEQDILEGNTEQKSKMFTKSLKKTKNDISDDNDDKTKLIDNSLKAVATTKKVVGFSLKSVFYVLKKTLTYILVTFLTFMLVGIITGIVVSAVFFKYVQEYVDGTIDISGLEFDLDQATGIYYVDENGNTIEIEGEKLHGSENRTWVSYNEMPQDLYLAFVCIEDKRFFEHNGVDIKRTFAAVVNFFIPMSNSYGGGSTITQQLIKNITKEDDVKIQRKVQEILRALDLEKQYKKEQILEMYLNTIYLSQNAYGVKAAARAYFGKDVSELSLVECAALASIPKSPTYYDPLRNPEHNLKRRREVLAQMYEQEKITLEQYNEAYAVEELTFASAEEETVDVIHSYYVDAVIEQVLDDLQEQYGYSREIASRLLYSGGLKIITAMDPFVQDTMESVFAREDYDFLSGMSGIMPESAMVVMDPKNGDVLGIIGGLGEKTGNRELNRATQSRRQCGSSIKPLSVYSQALDKGLITYATVIDDTPFETYTAENSPTGQARRWPPNTPDKYYGLVTINFAIEKSLNTVAVKVLNDLGVENSFKFLTEKLGFTSVVERVVTQSGEVLSDIGLAPLGLGGFTYGVTTMEMCAGYTMFANQGIYSSPIIYHAVYDNQNNLVLKTEKTQNVVIKESTAYIMTKMLENVVSVGTGNLVTLGDAATGLNVEVAGKTGSTNDDRDRYFIGYTPYYVGACWFGYDSNKALGKFTINPALALWDYVMVELHEHLAETNGGVFEDFDRPSNIVEVDFCIDSGKLPSEACYKDPRGDRIETGYFEKGTEPTEKCDTHVLVWWDKKNKAIASESTPESDLTQIALVRNETRSFQINIWIVDAEYVYREIPSNYTFPTSDKLPYFQNIIAKGVYIGTTYPTEGHHPVNSFSYMTYKKSEMPDATWFVVDKEPEEESQPDASETSSPEVSQTDTSVPNTSIPDTSIPDTSIPDVSESEESIPDTSTEESGMVIIIPSDESEEEISIPE